MNNQGQVVLAFGDGEHAFKLMVQGILEIEEKCDAPFASIFARVSAGAYKFADVYETLRLGLIGGGKSPVEAKKIVDRYTVPLAESSAIARVVLAAVMFGFEAAPLGKETAAPSEQSPSVSTPPSLSEHPSSLASVLEAWDRSVFGNSAPQ